MADGLEKKIRILEAKQRNNANQIQHIVLAALVFLLAKEEEENDLFQYLGVVICILWFLDCVERLAIVIKEIKYKKQMR